MPSIAITGPSSLVAGDSHLYTAQASNFAANPTIVWSVANADGAADAHASIDEATGELTALNAGDIIVTAAAQGTDVAANVNVSISAAAPLPSIAITGETNVTVGAVVSYSASASNFATAPTIHWSVSNADGAAEPHATIDAEGNLSAVHAGSVVVTATAQDTEVSGNLAVTIVAATPTNTPEQLPDPQVIISGENTVAEGRAIQLSASVDQYPDAVFSWSVSSEDGVAHASVDQNGMVTGIKAGMAIITVSTILNEKTWSATFAVSVFAPYLTIVAPENASSLFVGSSLQFAAQAVGLEDGLAVTWSIANADGTESAYASVDENGLVTGLAEGKVSVRATVTANNNTYSDAYALDIVPVEITSAVISTPQVEIFSCNTLQFSLSFLPENATYLPAAQDISWILEEGAASATINGGLLTPIVNEEGLLMGDDGQGGVTTVDAATVVVRGYYGEFYATANVTIRQAVTELFTEESLSVAMGRTEQIQFAVAPVGANQTITWSTSDSSIATVDERGSVTGVSAGDASITASIDGGRLTATTQVHVTQLAEDFDVFCPVSFLPIGDSCTVMTLFYPAASSDHLEWESSDPAVASINERGKITGHAAGSVSLRATNASGIVKTIELDVGVPADSILLFSDLFSFDYLVLGVGQVITLPVTLAPENATLASCISFDNDNGAYVITNGANSIKGVKKGRTSVTFISADGFASRTIQIRVVDKNRGVTKLSLNKSSISIQEGKTYSLRASVNSSASVKGVLWLSADANIAAVNGKGKVTAANPGTTTVYCLASSGILRSCSVTVKEVLPSSVKLNKSRLSIYAGKSYKLKATISPSNVLQEANRVLHWSTSNPMVALVTDEGRVFAMSPGTCTIKVTTANGKTRSCTVTVKAVRVSKVSASNPHGTLVTGGEYQMNCTLSPSNASNKEVTWKSSNNSVASVNSAGVVLAKSTGKATITATAKDGSGKRASFQVTVKAAPLEAFYVTCQNSETGEEISLEGTTLEMAYGQQIQVTPYVTPSISGVFTSSNESVATVTKNGLITATGGGTATITAIAGGQYSLSFQVHVATDSTVAYRALVIGQFTSSKQKGYLTFCANSCTGIYDTLKRSRLDGNGYSIATGRNYSDPQSVLNKIASTFADADEDDVSIIYMNAHGESHDGSYRWYLYYGDDPNDASTYLTGGQIVNAVKQIKGHVVLFLASCYSGVCLTDPENAETFDTAEINALAEEAQSELMSASATVRSMISSADKSAAGSISVLCAATDTTGCYLKTASTRSIDFFTEAATRGMGWNLLDDVSCTPAADSNGDGIVTLGELAPYVRSETTSSTEYYQKLFPSAFMGNPSATSCYYVSSKAKNLAIVGGMNAQ